MSTSSSDPRESDSDFDFATVPRPTAKQATSPNPAPPAPIGATGTEEAMRAQWAMLHAAVAERAVAFVKEGEPHIRTDRTRIDANFKVVPTLPEEDFSELHIEPLLEQALELLQRGVRDRAEFDDLVAKDTQQNLELQQFYAVDQIRLAEQQAGSYSVAYKSSSAELQSALTVSSGLDAIIPFMIQMEGQYYATPVLTRLREAHQLAGWLSGRTPYGPDSGFQAYNAFGHNWQISDHAMSAAKRISYHSTAVENDAFFLQRWNYEFQADAAKHRLAGLHARRQWDFANQWYAQWRADALRQVRLVHSAAATATDGPLNYSKRLDHLRARFEMDFQQALTRLKRVQRGMELVYGYSDPLPATVDQTFFDLCFLWAKRAVNWLVKFARREQSVAVPLSVRKLVGPDAWKSGCVGQRWEFTVPQTAFSKHAHVRLRGLSACVEAGSSGAAGPWSLFVLAPNEGWVRHLNGTTLTMPQKLPPCLIGRAYPRDSRRAADVVGTSALHNASPVGQWRIAAVSSSLYDHPRIAEDGDIELDLHLSYRTSQ